MKPHNLIVSIPHSGTDIPSEIRARIPHNDHVLRNESDLYTDQIFTLDGLTTVSTPYSRIIADPNRAPDEIYSENVLRAIGVVMLSLPEGTDTFEEDPSLEEISQWIEKYHKPYHDQLHAASHKAKFLIDGHSMCSKAAPGHFGGSNERADVVLGNQYFCSCSAETTDFFAAFFTNKGFSVAINDPYPGRYILGTYCSRLHLPGIQVEFNRKLYMNEETLDPNLVEIDKLNRLFNELVTIFCDWYEGPQITTKQDPVDMSEHTETLV
ncbi:MAG: N-formylglutamate amidohydrolase [Kiritimatiellales bacterium]|nr:N-formylglutamate amidohydrolase [Kiritimatiellales bacterium]